MLAVGTARAQEKGVEINGERWATRNVGEKGEFVDNPEDYGNYYTFEEARSACPDGWRTPTVEEHQHLTDVDSEWTTINGVAGRRFGSGSNSIFIPASGMRNPSNGIVYIQGETGYYWSSTAYMFSGTAYYMNFGNDHSYPSDNTVSVSCFSVRCVSVDRTVVTVEPHGVTINGVTWATHNVGEKGRFVDNPSDYGNLYTFEEAQTACPEGWRTPTTVEHRYLAASDRNRGTWTALNGVVGRRFGSGNNSIFLPAAGYRTTFGKETDQGTVGYYWSSTARGSTSGNHMYFSREHVNPSESSFSDTVYSVRCVR